MTETKKVTERSAYKKELQIGDVVRSKSGIGVIRYIGPLGGRKGHYLGLELELPRGKHDGSVEEENGSGVFESRRYFRCEKNHGVFMKTKNAQKITPEKLFQSLSEVSRKLHQEKKYVRKLSVGVGEESTTVDDTGGSALSPSLTGVAENQNELVEELREKLRVQNSMLQDSTLKLENMQKVCTKLEESTALLAQVQDYNENLSKKLKRLESEKRGMAKTIELLETKLLNIAPDPRNCEFRGTLHKLVPFVEKRQPEQIKKMKTLPSRSNMEIWSPTADEAFLKQASNLETDSGKIVLPDLAANDDSDNSESEFDEELNLPDSIANRSSALAAPAHARNSKARSEIFKKEELDLYRDGSLHNLYDDIQKNISAMFRDRSMTLEEENGELVSKISTMHTQLRKTLHIEEHVDVGKYLQDLQEENDRLHNRVNELEMQADELQASLLTMENHYIADELSEFSKQFCRDAFDAIDLNGDGTLDEQEFVNLLQSLRLDYSPQKASSRFQNIDSDNNGEICYEEFESMFTKEIAHLMMYETEDESVNVYETPRCRKGNEMYDVEPHTQVVLIELKERVGKLSSGGWIKLSDLKKSELQMLTGFEKQMCRDAFGAIDTSGDQMLDFDEFRALLQNLDIYIDEDDTKARFRRLDPDGSNEISFPEFETSFLPILASSMRRRTVDDIAVLESPNKRATVMYELDRNTDIICVEYKNKYARLSSGGWVRTNHLNEVKEQLI